MYSFFFFFVNKGSRQKIAQQKMNQDSASAAASKEGK